MIDVSVQKDSEGGERDIQKKSEERKRERETERERKRVKEKR